MARPKANRFSSQPQPLPPTIVDSTPVLPVVPPVAEPEVKAVIPEIKPPEPVVQVKEPPKVVVVGNQKIAPSLINSVKPTISSIPAELIFTREYFETAKSKGMDYAAKGSWQEKYAKFINANFPLVGKIVLDIGCAYGAITSALSEVAKVRAIGLDVSNHAKQASPFKNIHFVVNNVLDMKDVKDNSVDFIHSMFSLQYISETQVEQLLKEIKRVGKNDSIVFAVFPMAKEKSTVSGNEHFHTRDFWNFQAGKLGFKDGSKSYYTKLIETVVDNMNFMKEYNWNYVVYKIVK